MATYLSQRDPNGTRVWVFRNLTLLLVILGLVTSLAIQWAQFQQTSRLAESTAIKLELHDRDANRHIDPVRDAKQMQDIIEHLQRIDDKIDSIREEQRRGH